jgi:hypothetical protein
MISRILLHLLVSAFAPDGPLVWGVDETLERRRGAKIAAKGIYHDAVRSSHSPFVKASGLRWSRLMLRVPIAWAAPTWALPFLTALGPSERYARTHHRAPKTLTDWARQLLLVVRRWWPDRPLVAVADSTYATLPLLARGQRLANPITFIARLRLDAALYEPGPCRGIRTRCSSGPEAVVSVFIRKLSTSVAVTPSGKRTIVTLVSSPPISKTRWRTRTA